MELWLTIVVTQYEQLSRTFFTMSIEIICSNEVILSRINFRDLLSELTRLIVLHYAL